MCLILTFYTSAYFQCISPFFGILTCTVLVRLLAFASDQILLCVYTSIRNSTVSDEVRVTQSIFSAINSVL